MYLKMFSLWILAWTINALILTQTSAFLVTLNKLFFWAQTRHESFARAQLNIGPDSLHLPVRTESSILTHTILIFTRCLPDHC